MYVLGIETSCDETAAALLEKTPQGGFKILSEVVSSQWKAHQPYGGVVPELASREHLDNLPLVVNNVIEDSNIKLEQLGAIGVTRGPGLKGCLLVGYEFAKAISVSRKIPLLGVNHIEGHVLGVMLDNPTLTFPYLCLVVSGGHTEILEVKDVGSVSLMARTIDDAAGETFDKSANLLGFPYPGGAKLAALADDYSSSEFSLPRVMRKSAGFSFSGLKTAISLLVEKHREAMVVDVDLRGRMAFAIQEAIVDALIFKLSQAIKESRATKVAITGGVSANRRLRELVQNINGVKVYFPTLDHCMDNAAMIAYVAAKRVERKEKTDYNTTVISRWPIESV